MCSIANSAWRADSAAADVIAFAADGTFVQEIQAGAHASSACMHRWSGRYATEASSDSLTLAWDGCVPVGSDAGCAPCAEAAKTTTGRITWNASGDCSAWTLRSDHPEASLLPATYRRA